MNVDEIIKAIADQNAILDTWRENRVETSDLLNKLDQDISYGEKRRSELLAQLKAALAEDNPKPPEQIIAQNQVAPDKPMDVDKHDDDDDIYEIVKRSVRLERALRCADCNDIVEFLVSDTKSHEGFKLFTDQKQYIKAFTSALGKEADVVFDANSGELLGMAVLE